MAKDSTIVYFSDFIDGESVKNTLNDKGISFIEKNVSKDICARNEIILKGLRKLPIIKIDGKYLEGFDENFFK